MVIDSDYAHIVKTLPSTCANARAMAKGSAERAAQFALAYIAGQLESSANAGDLDAADAVAALKNLLRV